MTKIILKRIGAILAGMVTGIVLSLLTDVILEATGVFPSFEYQMKHGLFIVPLLVLATAYRCLYTAAGAYLTAALAPDKPERHVMVLGLIAVAANLAGLIITWGKGMGPAWYPIALTVLAYPSVWLGGYLRMRNAKK